jgi:flavin-dependent dehydrogenase
MTSQTSPTEAANLAHIAKVNWDAIVVGAGPAGVIAAHEVAKRGQRVLLVDKASFPRPKVCGGCLNLSMLATLERVGLTSAIHELDGVALNALRLTTGNHSATLPLPGGTSISREAMDAALIAAAVHDGVTFLSNTRVQWSEQADCRPQLELKQCRAGRSEAEPDKCIVATSVVVIASGLAGMNPFGDLQVEVEDTSLIGAGCVLSQQISEEACFDT